MWWYILIATTVSVLTAVVTQKVAEYWEPIVPVEKEKNSPTKDPYKTFLIMHLVGGAMLSTFVLTNSSTLYWAPWSLGHAARVALWLPIMLFCYDAPIYLFHRLCHRSKWLYYQIHYQHHEYNNPNSPLASIYGDFIEGVIITFFAIGQLFYLSAPVESYLLFLGLVSILAQLNHSGRRVEISYLYNSRFHYYHHKYRRYNFAEHLPILDWLGGTLHLPADYES